jgi:hypothetical protein
MLKRNGIGFGQSKTDDGACGETDVIARGKQDTAKGTAAKDSGCRRARAAGQNNHTGTNAAQPTAVDGVLDSTPPAESAGDRPTAVSVQAGFIAYVIN